MERASTMFLRGVIVVIGLIALAICTVVLPIGVRDGGGDYWPVIVALYAAAVPFFIALHQAWKLLRYIDTNTAFSNASVKALKYIKYCATTIAALFAAGMPVVFHLADQDDAPGIITMALLIIFASSVIAGFAAVLQKLLRNAIDIKKENDLTV